VRRGQTYGFDVLLQVEVHNDSVQAEDADQLQKAEQLKLFS